ncbi:MAG: 4a-hydroxytetrahydrobiopterin dehydratase [bacterium]|nr:4a-hydroxytetrahydrobiopterin dehydratase [bacterium]
MKLIERKCVPCEGGTPPFGQEQIAEYIAQLGKGWEVIEGTKIKKQFKFFDFKETMKFVSKVASIAEEQQHHPDMHVFYGKVVIELWTHAVNGLSENDFILAAKIDQAIEQE